MYLSCLKQGACCLSKQQYATSYLSKIARHESFQQEPARASHSKLAPYCHEPELEAGTLLLLDRLDSWQLTATNGAGTLTDFP
jgi:hypothetical protein